MLLHLLFPYIDLMVNGKLVVKVKTSGTLSDALTIPVEYLVPRCIDLS